MASGRAVGLPCFLCGAEGPGTLCSGCAVDLPSDPPSVVSGCNAATGFNHVAVGLRYAYPVDRLIHAFKNEARLELLPHLVAPLLQGAAHLPPGRWHLLPVPLHRARARRRGFNQSALIAAVLAEVLGLPMSRLVVARVGGEAAQHALGRRARLRNVRGAFSVAEGNAEEDMLLVDDVVTTGATLGALAACVRGGGARRVGALVLAATPPPGSPQASMFVA